MSKKTKVILLAAVMSVFFHLAVLSVFAFVQFSPATVDAGEDTIATARIYQVRQFLRNPPSTPKPKVEMPGETSADSPPENLLSQGTFSQRAAPDITDIDKQALTQNIESIFSSAGALSFNQEAGILGSRTGSRTIIYAVDCSGSMQGLFSWVQQQLKDSIENLQQDQYFSVVFFGNDGIFKLGDSLVRAGDKNKGEAVKFIDSIKPAGRAEALEALEEAVKIQAGRNNNGNSVIYFLTDGFELAQSSEILDKRITDLLNRLGSSAQINTIGFWPQEQDRVVLEKIARQSGGSFLLISDDYQGQNDEQGKVSQ